MSFSLEQAYEDALQEIIDLREARAIDRAIRANLIKSVDYLDAKRHKAECVAMVFAAVGIIEAFIIFWGRP